MRRSDQPSRPSARTDCFLSSPKTLLIPAVDHVIHRLVNVSAQLSVVAGFQLSISGRFWVSTEATPNEKRPETTGTASKATTASAGRTHGRCWLLHTLQSLAPAGMSARHWTQRTVPAGSCFVMVGQYASSGGTSQPRRTAVWSWITARQQQRARVSWGGEGGCRPGPVRPAPRNPVPPVACGGREVLALAEFFLPRLRAPPAPAILHPW